MSFDLVTKTLARLANEKGIALILVCQAALVLTLNLAVPEFWASDDEATYLMEAAALRVGLYPPDPARPVLYPYLLAQGMKLFGLDLFWLRLFQGAGLCLATALVYRLARIIAGKRPALVAALIFALFPDNLFFSLRFYRESLTALFFIALLNLVQLMLSKRRLMFAILAGVGAGLLVLIKPEFGSLLALMAIGGAILAVRKKDVRSHLLPWIVCGAIGLLTTLPAILMARSAYGEWIFINTYAGFNYNVSYCGTLASAKESGGKSFAARENDRYGEAAPLARAVLFAPESNTPFRERDRILREQAMDCIRSNPGQAAYLYFRRGLDSMFRPDHATALWQRRGDFGPGLVSALPSSLEVLNWAVGLALVLLLAPGLIRISRTRNGRLIAVSVVWFVVFYASVFYLSRFRIAVFTAFAIAAGAGLEAIVAAVKQKQKKAIAAFILYAALCLTLFMATQSPIKDGPWKKGHWIGRQTRTGVDQEQRKIFIVNVAFNFERAGRADLIETELLPYLERAGGLEPETLEQAETFCRQNSAPKCAGFFKGLRERSAP